MRSCDIAIVGAGPAGLSAALYAARFLRSTIVVHDGKSRAAAIPRSHNVPGFPDGIAGEALLDRMTGHAQAHGAQMIEAHVTGVRRTQGGFALAGADGPLVEARALILATGIYSHSIPLPADVHDDAVRHGVLRWCPICDGYEHRGQRLAVIGGDLSGVAEALFLRTYSDDVTLLAAPEIDLDADDRRALAEAGVGTVIAVAPRYRAEAHAMQVWIDGADAALTFDAVYPALGARVRNDLAEALGLALADDGKVAADAMMQTEVEGLWCAGDLVTGLDQISVAMGHGALAATRAHNWLRARDGETLDAVIDDAA